MPEQHEDGVEPKINLNPNPFRKETDLPKENLKNPDTYRGPSGESYSSFEEAENARQHHLSQMIDDKHARQAEKDFLKLGNSARVSERQRLPESRIITPKNPPKK